MFKLILTFIFTLFLIEFSPFLPGRILSPRHAWDIILPLLQKDTGKIGQRKCFQRRQWDSNRKPLDPQSRGLTTEPMRLINYYGCVEGDKPPSHYFFGFT